MKTILIVDDEKTVAGILKQKLTKEGYNVIVATNGEEGLEKTFSEKPDLILLDIIMPKMDGLTMLKKLRSDSRGKNIPVIVLTNLTDDPNRTSETREYGTADYLVKANWNINDLMKKVQATLGTK